MAIKLGLPKVEPEWLPLIRGVEVLVQPPSTPVVFAARARADAMMVDLAGAGEVVTRAGGHIVGPFDLSTPEALAETKQSLFVVALAEMAISDWRGVLLDPGDDEAEAPPLPFDAHHLANLMADPAMAETFLGKYYRPLHEVVSEGNV